MSRFHGPQHRGATREARDRRRLAANVRNVLTPKHRRRDARRRTERDCD